MEIRNITPLVRKLSTLIQCGKASHAQDLLPKERVYPLPDTIAHRLAMR